MSSVLRLVDVFESPEALRLAPGTDFGSFRIVEHLAAGGMGHVYRATQVSTAPDSIDRQVGAIERQVALKVLAPQANHNTELVSRFLSTTRAVNDLRNAHLVDVLEVATEGEQVYLAMELLQGGDLAAVRQRSGPFRVPQVVNIGMQVSFALQAIHAQGLLHRNLKPENVFLVDPKDGQKDGQEDRKDFVKVLDFGAAELCSGGRGDPNAIFGFILGTPEYMSPEQTARWPLDARSDVYSLGILLYWMLTDRLPFRATPADRLILARLAVDPPALPARTARGEALPHALAAIVSRCLKRDPRDRFETIAEVGSELAKLRTKLAKGSLAGPFAGLFARIGFPKAAFAGPRWVDRRLWSGAAAAVVLVGALAALLAPARAVTSREKKPAPSARAPAATPRAGPGVGATAGATAGSGTAAGANPEELPKITPVAPKTTTARNREASRRNRTEAISRDSISKEE